MEITKHAHVQAEVDTTDKRISTDIVYGKRAMKEMREIDCKQGSTQTDEVDIDTKVYDLVGERGAKISSEIKKKEFVKKVSFKALWCPLGKEEVNEILDEFISVESDIESVKEIENL